MIYKYIPLVIYKKISKRKFYEIEQDDGKDSPTSNRVTKRAKLMNSSDSKFKIWRKLSAI